MHAICAVHTSPVVGMTHWLQQMRGDCMESFCISDVWAKMLSMLTYQVPYFNEFLAVRSGSKLNCGSVYVGFIYLH